MELLEGQTLKHRIAGKPIEISELAGNRHSDREWAGCGARQGNRPSRHQAGEYFSGGARTGEDFGFWLGETDANGEAFRGVGGHYLHAHENAGAGGRATDQPGKLDGHGGVYVSGASARRRAGRAVGFIFAGRGAVRNGHGNSSLLRGDLGGDFRRHFACRAALGERVERASAAGAGKHSGEDVGKGAGPALPDGGGIARGFEAA